MVMVVMYELSMKGTIEESIDICKKICGDTLYIR